MRIFKRHEIPILKLAGLVAFGFLLPLFHASDAHAQYEADRKLPCNAYCRKWMGWDKPDSTGTIVPNSSGPADRAARQHIDPPVVKKKAERKQLRHDGRAVSAGQRAGQGPERTKSAARHAHQKQHSEQASHKSEIGSRSKHVDQASDQTPVMNQPGNSKSSSTSSEQRDRAAAMSFPSADVSSVTRPASTKSGADPRRGSTRPRGARIERTECSTECHARFPRRNDSAAPE